MISGISNILTLIVNSMFDIKDAMSSKVLDLNANVITLACVCTDDLPIDTTSSYCKSLEVYYAVLFRSILQSSIRNRGNANAKDYLKSLPILSNYDLVEYNEELGAINSVAESLFGNKKAQSASAAVNAFLESVKYEIDKVEVRDLGLEADLLLKETRGGVPTFVDVTVTITVPGGRAMEKVIPIGVQVRPKIVSPQEMMSFVIKQNHKLNEADNATKIKAKKFAFKSLFNKNRIMNNKIEGGVLDNSSKRVLSNLLESTKGINKPFVCLLLSGYCYDMLKDAGVDIKKPALLKNIYNTLPIMSISIFDTSLDMIHYSLMKSQTAFITATASSFNTDISQLQKTLAEGLRVSKMLG